jgi:hypothetical protein
MAKASQPVVVSPKFSLKGWKFGEWLKGNWATIKELIKVGIPLLIGYVSTTNPALVGIITIVGKLILDTGEYYIKEYKQ